MAFLSIGSNESLPSTVKPRRRFIGRVYKADPNQCNVDIESKDVKMSWILKNELDFSMDTAVASEKKQLILSISILQKSQQALVRIHHGLWTMSKLEWRIISKPSYLPHDLPTFGQNVATSSCVPASSTVRFLDALHLLTEWCRRFLFRNLKFFLVPFSFNITVHLFWEWFGVNVNVI